MPNRILFFILFLLSTLSSFSQDGDFFLVREHIVYFETNQYHFNTSDTAFLNFVLDCQKEAHFYVEIDAHTDIQGSLDFNEVLSQKRSKSVVQELQNQGISIKNIKAQYFGETHPVVSDSDAKRKLNRRAVLSLYRLQKQQILKGIVQDESGQALRNAQIEIRGKNLQKETTTNNAGQFQVAVPAKRGYKLTVWAKGAFHQSKLVSSTKSKQIQFTLPSVKIGSKIPIKDLHFLRGKSNILGTSLGELASLRKTLSLNTDWCFEIAGHVNMPNAMRMKRSDFSLSIERALAIYDSLIVSGVAPQRMTAKGYGNWEMLFPRAKYKKQEERNRRVEIRILDCKTIQGLENDVSSKPSRHYNLLSTHYTTINQLDCFRLFSQPNQRTIAKNLRAIKAAEINPHLFTYKQLIDPNLVLDK